MEQKSLFTGGLGLKLISWFLIMSILPISLISYFNYRNCHEAVMSHLTDAFNEEIDLHAKIISSNFEMYKKDLLSQAENNQNIIFLNKLKKSFKQSATPLKDFVKSSEWNKLTLSHNENLADFKKSFGYYDLLILDTYGNILYSIARESDLGENIFKGQLASTLLSKACQESLKTGKTIFSDCQYYAPSEAASSFWVTVMKDKSGRKIGLMALHLPINNLNNTLNKIKLSMKTEENYIIGTDLILRASTREEDGINILKSQLDNVESRKWLKGLTAPKYNTLYTNDQVTFYKNSNGMNVIGVNKTITIGGKQFGIIAEIDEAEAMEPIYALRDASVFMVIITTIIVTLVSMLITGNIVRPILKISNVAKGIAQGDLQHELKVRAKNEIGALGNYINLMLKSLRKNDKENRRQNWFQTGVNKLSKITIGNLTIDRLSASSIIFTSKYINAQVGTLYIVNPENPDYLDFYGGFAVSSKTIKSERIRIGEGLAGQVAKDMTPFCLQDVPDDYLIISSTMGEMSPKNITVIPCIYQDELIAIMEFGSLKALTELEMDFLTAAAKTIAVEINSAIARKNKSALLKSVQEQAEKLQAQQEELRTANEELEEQSEELQAQQEELRTANEELEEKAEELQSQQEELRTANEELTEKANALEAQKVAILQQNVDLEEARTLLVKKAEELEVTSKYKSEFLANMSHELRTPLNSILLLSDDLMKNKDKHLDEEEVEAAEIINKGGSDLLLLINDILNLSKIEAGKMSVEILDVKMQSFIDDLKMQFARLMQEKGLSFETSLSDGIPETIKTDPLKLGQIIKNIISNAIKFTHQGGIYVNIYRPAESSNIHLSGFEPENTIAISIKDTGIGIAEDKQKIVFEAFQQADGSTTRQYGGTGLGLSISRELSKLLGGIIEMDSELDEGTTVTLYIPDELQLPDSDATVAHTTNAPAHRKNTDIISTTDYFNFSQVKQMAQFEGDKAVVIIDKNPAFVKLFCKQCEDHSLTPIIAENVAKGIELVNSRPVSAIILNLDFVVGKELLQLKALQDNPKTKDIPIHIISHADESGEAMSCGILDISKKLISVEKINAAFGDIVSSSNHKPGNAILIVEDNEVQAKAISKLIGDVGAKIVVAHTGSEAIDILRSKSIACVILDLGLPDMPGLTLLEKIDMMKDIEAPPTIIYTGKDLSASELNSLYKYSSSIIIKGVKSAEILLQETTEFLRRVAEQKPEEAETESNESSDLDSVLDGKKVLVVDDDMRNVFALSRILTDKGIEVIKAEDGKKAITILEKEDDIDIVLMDIMMPNMNGYEAMSEIRRSDSKVKKHDIIVIAVTAKAMKEDRQKCLDAGADDYLIKPIVAEKLFSIIKIWLKKSKGNP